MEHKELEDENLSRVGKFRKDEADEVFLENLNDYLALREKEFEIPDGPVFPNIFIFGLPRSGTTLLAQLLFHCLDVGYINNFIARFWKAPVQGIRLSRLLLKDERRTSFESEYGVTSGLTDSHEFGYFWTRWLGDGLHVKAHHDVKWQELQHQLRQIALTFNKPVMYKNVMVGMQLKGMFDICKESIFIRVQRDPVDNALSILKGREERFGNREHWWSIRPPGYEKWLHFSYFDQIALQVTEINKLHDTGIKENNIPEITVPYPNLCANPGKILSLIEERLIVAGFPVNRLNPPPLKFKHSTYTKNDDYIHMKEALKKL
jgi:hypothetical protein